MPHQTAPLTPRQKRREKAERARKILAGAALRRDDSDDELGEDDHPWEWIYENGKGGGDDDDDDDEDGEEDDKDDIEEEPRHVPLLPKISFSKKHLKFF